MRDQLEIITPESVAFSYEVAGIGSRFAAFAIDALLVGSALLALGGVAGLILSGLGMGVATLMEAAPWVVGALIVLSFLLVWGYFPFFEIRWQGQTPGKRAMGLRVVQENGAPIGVWEGLLRNLLRLVDFLPGLVPFGVGMITMFLSPRWKRLGDYAAGTVVIREVRYELPGSTPPTWKEQGSIASEFSLPPDAARRLRPEEMEVVRRFLERREELPPQPRGELAARLAFPLAERLQVPAQALRGEGVEAFLEEVWACYRGGPRPAWSAGQGQQS